MKEKETIIIVTSDLKRPWWGQIYMIIVMHTSLLRGSITVPNMAAAGAKVNNTNKRVRF